MSDSHSEPGRWQRAVDGDRDAFEEALAPFQDDLMRAAEREIAFYQEVGRLQDRQLTPEELVGETLVQAWDRRTRFDLDSDALSLRAWLLGLQHRTLQRLTDDDANYAARKAISLDEEVPTTEDQDAVQEDFYEFRQPFDVTTYEEIIPGSTPADVEVELDATGAPSTDRLSEEELNVLDEAVADGRLVDHARAVALFHDEFDLTLPEVAQIMNYSIQDAAEALNLARANVRARLGSTEDLAPDDRIDSYTGEPISENPTYDAEAYEQLGDEEE